MSDSSVESIARRFVPGHGAVDIQPLHAGLVNASFRVTRDGRAFVLRVRSARGEAPGVDRLWEQRVLDRVSPARLGPVVLVCEPAAGVLVTQWVEGVSWSATQASSPAVSAQVARLARAVHQVPAPQPRRVMTPASWRDLYLSALRGADVDASRRMAIEAWTSRFDSLLTDYASLGPVDFRLCHSDLHRHNIVPGEAGLVLLDWEYAHVGDPFWDLAGWTSCCDLNEAARAQFLADYVQGEPSSAQGRRLQVLCAAYDYICLLWLELFQSVIRDRGESAAMIEELHARTASLTQRFAAY